jgi:5-methyltetrahydropteroyltriglutamate--homocysteine methyltransferase
MTMPYHADVIGSLLRPHYLSEARAALDAGRMNMEEFKRIEDRAVDQAIAMQEGCGLDVVNDGELRRFSFLDHLLGDMEGVAAIPGAPVRFHAPDPAQDWDWHPPFTVTGRIRRTRPMMTIEEFSYARADPRPGEDHDAEPAGHVRRMVTGTFSAGLLRSVRALCRRSLDHP